MGAWSTDGSKVRAVGALGAFMTQEPSATVWQNAGPTVRDDLVSVDVGVDGATIAVSSLPTQSPQGEVRFAKEGALSTSSGGGLAAPSLPVAVTVLNDTDAWILSNGNSMVGVAHWTGHWGPTFNIGRFGDSQPNTIWAPAKDDVWASARKKLWHYDGAKWNEVPVDATYGSIHGTGPNDVWFAGEGVAHWDGSALTRVASLTGKFAGVWSSTPGRVWLWGDGPAVLFDGSKTAPVTSVLQSAADWDVRGIAETTNGDVFVLTKKSVGSQLLWFDPKHEKLVDVVSSDLDLTTIRGRGEKIVAVGGGGAFLQFVPPALH